jgi:hypothetical protein
VVVPVVLVSRVTVPVVRVVHMVVVRHGDMPTLRAVLMGVPLVDRVLRPRALVDMVIVHAVDVAVVRIVGVIAMRDRDVAAAVTVDVRMTGVGAVVSSSGHGRTPHSGRRKAGDRTGQCIATLGYGDFCMCSTAPHRSASRDGQKTATIFISTYCPMVLKVIAI